MRSIRVDKAARWAAPLYLLLLAGFLLGFELAWLLARYTWLDMRFPGELAIPAGIVLGLTGGLWRLGRPPRPEILRCLFWLQAVGGLPLLYAALSRPQTFWHTAPILFRQALGLPPPRAADILDTAICSLVAGIDIVPTQVSLCAEALLTKRQDMWPEKGNGLPFCYYPARHHAISRRKAERQT